MKYFDFFIDTQDVWQRLQDFHEQKHKDAIPFFAFCHNHLAISAYIRLFVSKFIFLFLTNKPLSKQ